MNKRYMIGLTVLIAVSLSACIETDHLYLSQDRFPPRPANSPVEFLTDPPSRPFTKLAIVEAIGESSWEEIRAALGEEAGKIGADAVMELSMGSNTEGSVVGSGGYVVGAVSSNKKLTGVAIRYK